MWSSPNYFLPTGHHDPPAGRKLCIQRLIHAQGLSTLADKLGMVFGTSKLKNCMVTIFVLKKKNVSAWETMYSYQAITFDETLFMERMALQQMIDKKNTSLFI